MKHRWKGRRLKGALAAAAVLAAAVLLGFSLPALGRRKLEFDPDAVAGARATPIDAKKLQEELQSQAGEGSIRMKINGRPVFSAAGEGDLLFQNPLGNTGNLQAVITLDKTGQELYRSGVLPPGGQELRVTLSVVPPPGSYDATAHISVIDPDTGEKTGSMTAQMEITIEE